MMVFTEHPVTKGAVLFVKMAFVDKVMVIVLMDVQMVTMVIHVLRHVRLVVAAVIEIMVPVYVKMASLVLHAIKTVTRSV